jgi:hypothetical protein
MFPIFDRGRTSFEPLVWASVHECPPSARAKYEYGQTVHLARLILLFLVLAGGVTACDHSSNRSEVNAGRLFTGSEVRRAFTEAGIQLVADSSVTEFPQLRASFQGGDGMSVLVYESAGSRVVILLQDETTVGRRNVIVTYPKGSPCCRASAGHLP